MLIRRAFVFELKKLTPTYSKLLRQFAGCARRVHNDALEYAIQQQITTGKYPSYQDLCKWLTQHKQKFPFLSEAHSQVLQLALKNLSLAIAGYLKRINEFPHFKKRSFDEGIQYPKAFN